jgi:glycosyltransferase involved in cell wall biosynthesis
MTVLVTVPYFGCPDLVEKAVRSILAQTERDIAVLVIGDGEAPPVRIRDNRLEVVTLRENRGPYYCQQVALTANPFGWYTPVGADDYLAPDHIERLLAVGSDLVLTGAVWFHPMAGAVSIHRGNYEVGLFRNERMLAIGGHNSTERVGQDSLLIHLLKLVYPDVRATDRPTYHRVKRAGSLMTSPLTGKGTPYRNDVRRRNRLVYAECGRLRDIAAIRRYRDSLVPSWMWDQVARDAGLVAERLGPAVAA